MKATRFALDASVSAPPREGFAQGSVLHAAQANYMWRRLDRDSAAADLLSLRSLRLTDVFDDINTAAPGYPVWNGTIPLVAEGDYVLMVYSPSGHMYEPLKGFEYDPDVAPPNAATFQFRHGADFDGKLVVLSSTSISEIRFHYTDDLGVNWTSSDVISASPTHVCLTNWPGREILFTATGGVRSAAFGETDLDNNSTLEGGENFTRGLFDGETAVFFNKSGRFMYSDGPETPNWVVVSAVTDAGNHIGSALAAGTLYSAYDGGLYALQGGDMVLVDGDLGWARTWDNGGEVSGWGDWLCCVVEVNGWSYAELYNVVLREAERIPICPSSETARAFIKHGILFLRAGANHYISERARL